MTNYVAVPFKNDKDRFRLVAKLENEIRREKRIAKLEVDLDKQTILYTYDDGRKFH